MIQAPALYNPPVAEESGLGTRIRARRTALGLTLAQVAQRAGLSEAYVSNVEHGHRTPTLAVLYAIAEALGLALTDLLGEDPPTGRPDLLQTALAEAPYSLITFTRSDHFRTTIERLAEEQNIDPEELHTRLTIGMAIAPRRNTDNPTDHDWRRLLDAYTLILRDS